MGILMVFSSTLFLKLTIDEKEHSQQNIYLFKKKNYYLMVIKLNLELIRLMDRFRIRWVNLVKRPNSKSYELIRINIKK